MCKCCGDVTALWVSSVSGLREERSSQLLSARHGGGLLHISRGEELLWFSALPSFVHVRTGRVSVSSAG